MKNLLSIGCLSLIVLLLAQNGSQLIQPIQVVQSQSMNPITTLLNELRCPKDKQVKIAKAIELASVETNLDPLLITVLLYTESGFNKYAVSQKNYKGLMQTPTATFQFEDVDVLHGARILQEKLKIADGNLLKAISLYKGGNNPVAKKQAIDCLSLYRRVMGRG